MSEKSSEKDEGSETKRSKTEILKKQIEAGELVDQIFKPISNMLKEGAVHYQWMVSIAIFVITILLTFLAFSESNVSKPLLKWSIGCSLIFSFISIIGGWILARSATKLSAYLLLGKILPIFDMEEFQKGKEDIKKAIGRLDKASGIEDAITVFFILGLLSFMVFIFSFLL